MTRQKAGIVFAIAACALFGVIAWRAAERASFGMAEDSGASANPAVGRFAYERGGFSLRILPSWRQGDVERVEAPRGIAGIRFAFQKEGTSCVFAYAEIPRGALQTAGYGQVTPGERVMLGNAQIDSWWWAPKEGLPPGFSPEFEGRRPTAGEVLVGSAYYFVPLYALETEPAFLLYAADGGTVPDGCVSDETAILRSIGASFAESHLDRVSEGFLRIVEDEVSQQRHFAFKAKEADRYALIPPLRSLRAWEAYVHGNHLYTLEEGSVMLTDVFGGVSKPLSGLATSTDRVVTSLYIRSGKMWYLRGGARCGEYMTRCGDLELYEIDPQGGTPRLLADGIALQSGSIAGYDPAKHLLYLAGGVADAGCASYQYSVYSYEKNILEPSLRGSYCADDEGVESRSARAAAEALRARIDARRYRDTVRVSGGRILEPVEGEGDGYQQPALFQFVFSG